MLGPVQGATTALHVVHSDYGERRIAKRRGAHPSYPQGPPGDGFFPDTAARRMAGMDGIRAFRREDIPEVARLWLRVFRRRAEGVSTPLQDYFREIFFDGPWRDPELPSLVYEEGAMGIVGFLGVIPRTMIFEQQPIRVAVPCQLMADERARTYPATKLMR